jgi:hypothetical protein
VEYADTGQDEADLAVKIRELLAAGTCLIWADVQRAAVLLEGVPDGYCAMDARGAIKVMGKP